MCTAHKVLKMGVVEHAENLCNMALFFELYTHRIKIVYMLTASSAFVIYTVEFHVHTCFQLQALLNVSSLLLSPESVPLWEGASDVDTAVGDLLVAVNGIGEALIPLVNQSSSQVVTLRSDNIGEWVSRETCLIHMCGCLIYSMYHEAWLSTCGHPR